MDAAPAVVPASLPTLYPLQAEGVERFLDSAGLTVGDSGTLRFILGWATGCGKTAGALSAANVLARRWQRAHDEACRLPRVLVVTPAVVRRHWVREVARWAPAFTSFASAIEYGRHRHLPAEQGRGRAWAYRQALQVVSYDLLKDVEATGWHLIILDELHHVGAPLSKQSKLVRSLLRANEQAHVLGLTATPFPTEVKQLWNPLRLLFGETAWGKPARTGDVSWDFARRYCNVVKGEYGTSISGCRVDRREELQGRLSNYIHFLHRDQLLDNLPPLDVQLLELSASILNINEKLAQWAQDKVAEGVRRIVVLTMYRDDAREIFAALSCAYPQDVLVSYIDGAMPTAQRDEELARVESHARPSVLVGTHGALAEGVRLMWAEEVVVKDWSQSPGRVVQLLGRFQSVGSTARPHVSLLSGPDQWGASITLLERTRTMLAVTGASPTASKLETLLAEPQPEDVASLLHDMLSEVRDTETWADDSTERTP